ncbi:MAG: hypothetical protein ACO3EG_08275, partial [Chitinophagaceae bacterium]
PTSSYPLTYVFLPTYLRLSTHLPTSSYLLTYLCLPTHLPTPAYLLTINSPTAGSLIASYKPATAREKGE